MGGGWKVACMYACVRACVWLREEGREVVVGGMLTQISVFAPSSDFTENLLYSITAGKCLSPYLPVPMGTLRTCWIPCNWSYRHSSEPKCGCWEHSPSLSEPPLQPRLYFVLRLFFPAPERKEVLGTEGTQWHLGAITGYALAFSFTSHPSLFP